MTIEMDFDPDHFADKMVEEMIGDIKGKIGPMRCKIHGKEPVFAFKNGSLDISTCCQPFRNEVDNAIVD